MRLRLLAPTVIDFSIATGVIDRDPAGYEQFWKTAEANWAKTRRHDRPSREGSAVVTFHHSRSTSRFNRYKTIDQPSLERSVEVITVEVTPPAVTSANSSELWRHVDTIVCRLYDHGIAIIEVEIGCGDTPEADKAAAVLDGLQAAAVEFGEEAAEFCHDAHLVPLIEALRDTSVEQLVLAPPMNGPAGDTGDGFGRPLWVARSLVLAAPASAHRAAIFYWVKDVLAETPEEAGGRHPVHLLFDGKENHLVKWLNYVFIVDAPNGPGAPLGSNWEALRLSQYFYAALDSIDSRLGAILAASLDIGSGRRARELRQQLEQSSRRAQILEMQLHEVTKYLPRSVRQEMAAILEYWEFDEAVIEPVRRKVEACIGRLDDLEKRRSARSSLFTDLILLPITIASIVTTALALTEFGRAMTTDPDLAGVDAGRSDLIAWIASQPADVILVSSGALSIAVIILYVYFRRRHSG